jgi:hypothetical protein
LGGAKREVTLKKVSNFSPNEIISLQAASLNHLSLNNGVCIEVWLFQTALWWDQAIPMVDLFDIYFIYELVTKIFI